ncbi:MAG: 5,6-dimethylbenzimidazole synthase [Oleiphilus sp.]|nr:MAG: 5,6-dimethylbenzimidazole synthase [Oleiphilus sp.]
MGHREFEHHEQRILEEIMRLRRDVRGNRFLNTPLEEQVLDQILHAGLLAPSVGFSQPWRIIDIRNRETKQGVAKIFAEENTEAAKQFEDQRRQQYQQLKLEGILEAPVNLAVFYQHSDEAILGQTSMPVVGEYSTVCAIQNMWLMARALNVGMGWVSILDRKKMEALLGASRHQKFVAYLCLGYVDKFYDQPELEMRGWEQRKRIEELIFRDSFSSQGSDTCT